MLLLLLSVATAVPEDQARVIATEILSQLKDPASAQWQNFRINDDGRFCVEVNAKNSFGGYTGFQTWMGKYSTKKGTAYAVQLRGDIAARVTCASAGL